MFDIGAVRYSYIQINFGVRFGVVGNPCMSPWGTVWTVPLMSLSVVTLRARVPQQFPCTIKLNLVAYPVMVLENQENPVIISLTRYWLPKPTATPTIPAPVSRGPIGTPNS